MLGIKKLDLYILKKFLPLFFGAFFICLFVFMMQFTWRYIDELIGKGLSLDILGQFFWYMGITLIPMSLPLAILLASLITFGNMGEQLELLSMKAAGVPLVRIMRPILMLVIVFTGMSFYFQNKTAPDAQISLRTLLFSMKQAQPAVEIPEGVFYNEIPNLNLYVQRKNAETGMLYQTIIYKTDQGFDRAQIVLADSGRLEMTADKLHLRLDLWNGEQFENLQSQGMSMMQSAHVPFDRETFAYKRFLIDFDSNFAMMDKNMLRDMPQAKSMWEIEASVDSMNAELDSIGKIYYRDVSQRWFDKRIMSKKTAAALRAAKPLPFDSILARTSPSDVRTARQMALNTVRSVNSELEWKSLAAQTGDNQIRRHWVEWHQKMTLSLACLLFFFIGAPLGAIIRKGGLGLPAVISVLIFIFYYIINTSGMKMARDGSWNMVYGMWISSVVLLPFGVFLTYKANKDSVVFNAEMYLNFFRALLGLRTSRHLNRKEVIIHDPDYARMSEQLDALRDDCREYARVSRLKSAPSYVDVFFRHNTDHHVEEIGGHLETIVEELSNAKDPRIVSMLNNFPVVYVHAHTSPFEGNRANKIAGVFFPLGFVLWCRIWRFRFRLLRDMKQITETCERLSPLLRHVNADGMIEGTALPDEEGGESASGASAGKAGWRRRWSVRRVGALLVALVIVFLAGWYAQRYLRKYFRAKHVRNNVPHRQQTTPPPAVLMPHCRKRGTSCSTTVLQSGFRRVGDEPVALGRQAVSSDWFSPAYIK